MSKTGLLIAAVLLVAGVAAYVLIPDDEAAVVDATGPTVLSEPAPNAPMVAVSLPAQLSPEAQIGQRGFEAACADCHGLNAAGQDGVAPPLVHIIYEPSHHGDGAFQNAVQNGVRAHHWNFGPMLPVEGLTDADVRAITTYIRELQRENGIF